MQHTEDFCETMFWDKHLCLLPDFDVHLEGWGYDSETERDSTAASSQELWRILQVCPTLRDPYTGCRVSEKYKGVAINPARELDPIKRKAQPLG